MLSLPLTSAADQLPVFVAAEQLPVFDTRLPLKFTLSKINLIPACISPLSPISSPICKFETETLESSAILSTFPLPSTLQNLLVAGG